MKYFRDNYSIPLKRGAKVKYRYEDKIGTVLSADPCGVYVRFKGEKKRRGPFHPTWEIEYL